LEFQSIGIKNGKSIQKYLPIQKSRKENSSEAKKKFLKIISIPVINVDVL